MEVYRDAPSLQGRAGTAGGGGVEEDVQCPQGRGDSTGELISLFESKLLTKLIHISTLSTQFIAIHIRYASLLDASRRDLLSTR